MIVPYIRVSSEEQAKSGLGLEAQENSIRKEASYRKIELRLDSDSKMFCDPGVKGDLPFEKREGLQAAIKALRRGDILMVAKLDRLSRCGHADTAAIESAIKRRRARLVSAAGEGTEPKDKYDVGAYMQKDVTEMFSRIEKRYIGARTHYALQAKRRRGELSGGIPYGFVSIPDENVPRTKRDKVGHRLEPQRDEQAAILVMLKARAAGLGYRRIAKQLEIHGCKPRGKKWHPESIRSILIAVQEAIQDGKCSPTGQTANVVLPPGEQDEEPRKP